MAGPPLSVSVGTSSGDEKLLKATSQDFSWDLEKIPRMYLHGKNISVYGKNAPKRHRPKTPYVLCLLIIFFKKVFFKEK